MRVPLSWLREYCDPPLDVHGVAERLTMTGTKVETIHHHGVGGLEHFLVGRVLEVAPHANADRLKVCKVDLGDAARGEAATIVCGAPNVAAGQTVAVARPGAVLPDGTTLKQARLRGVLSEGMILSESELELGADGAGILVLNGPDAEFSPGTPLAELLPIATEVLELEVTPNRPDCLSVYGVARELHAATGAPLAPSPWSEDAGSPGPVEEARVIVECPELCLRFTARVFEDVTIAPSPPWLRARLLAAGQRPINNVVDITNYAMLLTGQPLHAFDLDRIACARLTVRRAHEGEQVQTLDGVTRTLDSEMVLIADEEGPTSIAAVMGGARSEVGPDTGRVLLEVANWDGANVHRTSLALGLRSEASARFEKGLAPKQCMHAQAVATRLMLELCGARVREGTIDVAVPREPAAPILLREQRVRAILGVPVARERQAEILRELGFDVQDAHEGLQVGVPALRRADVTREIDLIEEVARIDGLERLPATLPTRRGAVGRLNRAQRLRRTSEDALAGRGLHEIAGWSFAGPDLLEKLRVPQGDRLREVVALENPLSREQSIMRPTLLGSVLDAAQHNIARNGPDVAIFESGTVFLARGAGQRPEERQQLAALLSGALARGSWREAPGQADFFAAKALLEALLAKLGVRWSVRAGQWPYLHSGRAAAVLATGVPPRGGGEQRGGGQSELGFLGELHPQVARAWDIERAAVFVLDLGLLIDAAPVEVHFQPFASVPPLRQDIAVALPQRVPAGEVLAAVRAAGGELLEDVSVFDVYSGEQVGAGRRSLALALTFRAPDRTLADDDVRPARERMLRALEQLGGELRA